jgi:general secretion pathway protein G
MEMYRLKFHRYPTTAEGTSVLVNPPRGDRFMDAVPDDPWGEAYVFQSPGSQDPKGFDLYSKGPDNQADTDDDVR